MAKTYVQWTGDGSRTVYPVAFKLGYFSTADIYVYQGEDHTQQLAYTWQDSTTIELATPITINETLRIRRVVVRDSTINSYKDGAVLDDDHLDDSFKQGLMIAEEVADGFASVTGNIVQADLLMTNHQIKQVSPAVEGSDAVTLSQLIHSERSSGVLSMEQPRQVADGVTTVFASPSTGAAEVNTQGHWVFVQGIKQRSTTDYTINPTTGNVEFVEAPPINTVVDVVYYAPNSVVGATGTFTAQSGETVTVVAGLITEIA